MNLTLAEAAVNGESMSDFNTTEFLNGQRCYLDNKECPVNASPSFQRGYGVEYEKVEIATHQSMNMANNTRK